MQKASPPPKKRKTPRSQRLGLPPYCRAKERPSQRKAGAKRGRPPLLEPAEELALYLALIRYRTENFNRGEAAHPQTPVRSVSFAEVARMVELGYSHPKLGSDIRRIFDQLRYLCRQRRVPVSETVTPSEREELFDPGTWIAGSGKRHPSK